MGASSQGGFSRVSVNETPGEIKEGPESWVSGWLIDWEVHLLCSSPEAAEGAMGPEDGILGCTAPCVALPDSALPGSLCHIHEL